MARYAIVENGIITNIVEAEAEFATQQGWISIPTHHNDNVTPVNPGDLHSNGTLSPKPKDLVSEWKGVRAYRNDLLIKSDSNVLPDRWAAMNTATQQAWTTYRQALRDIPETYGAPTGDPELIVWPTVPN